MTALIALAWLSATPADGPKLEFLDFGVAIFGERLKQQDLKGKFAFVVEFGITEKKCLDMIPTLNLLLDEYAEYKFVVVALHRQEGFSNDALKARCEALGIRFTVCDKGAIGGTMAEGITGCALWNPAGECVFNGRVRDCEVPIRKTLALKVVAEIDEPTKAMLPVVDGLKVGGTLMDALKKLQTVKNSSDKTTAEQAKGLIEKITAPSRKKFEAIQEQMKEDPLAGYEAAVALAARWKGHDLGSKAADLAAKLKNDKTVAAELKARPLLESLRKLDAALLKAATATQLLPASPEFKKKFAQQYKELKKAHDSMKRLYPDAKATKDADALMEKYES